MGVVQYIADAGGAYKERDYPYKGTLDSARILMHQQGS